MPEIVKPTPTQAPAAPVQQTDNTMLWLVIGAIILIAIIAFAFYAMKKKPEKRLPQPHVKQHRK
jgi:bacteriorhodopsin